MKDNLPVSQHIASMFGVFLFFFFPGRDDYWNQQIEGNVHLIL